MTVNKRDIQRFIRVFVAAETIFAIISFLFIKFLKAENSSFTVTEIWSWIAVCLMFGVIIALAASMLTHSKEDIRKGFLSVFLIMALIGISAGFVMIFILDHFPPDDPWIEIEPTPPFKILSFVKDLGICGGDICICVNTEHGDIYCSVEPFKVWEKLNGKRLFGINNSTFSKDGQKKYFYMPSKPKGKIIDVYDYTIRSSVDSWKSHLDFILMDDGRILYWKEVIEYVYIYLSYYCFGIIGFIIAALSSLALRFERKVSAVI